MLKKHKAIAIPVTFVDDKPRFLTVRDRRFKDWTFGTGGCRRREIMNPLRCALRELEEETRGVISLRSGEYADFKFTVKDPQEANVELVYNVFVLFVPWKRVEQQAFVKKFYEEKQRMTLRKIQKQSIKRTHDENDNMSFDTLPEFNARKQWKMIQDKVIANPEFYSCMCMSSANRKTFNISSGR